MSPDTIKKLTIAGRYIAALLVFIWLCLMLVSPWFVFRYQRENDAIRERLKTLEGLQMSRTDDPRPQPTTVNLYLGPDFLQSGDLERAHH